MEVQLVSTEGERILYFPSFFVSIGLAGFFVLFFEIIKIWLPALMIYVLSSAYSLYLVNLNWATAGSLSFNISKTIAEKTTGANALILNVPDNYRGAFVFRNGLYQAVTEFQIPNSIRSVRVIARQTVESLNSRVHFFPVPGTARSFGLCTLDKRERFIPSSSAKITRRAKRPGYQPGHCVEFVLGEEIVNWQLFMYQSGKVEKMDHETVLSTFICETPGEWLELSEARVP
jgi:hypothetical protein